MKCCTSVLFALWCKLWQDFFITRSSSMLATNFSELSTSSLSIPTCALVSGIESIPGVITWTKLKTGYWENLMLAARYKTGSVDLFYRACDKEFVEAILTDKRCKFCIYERNIIGCKVCLNNNGYKVMCRSSNGSK